MTDFLKRIIALKKEEIEESRKNIPESELRKQAEAIRDKRPFLENLEKPGPSGINIIAEIKRASPSKGLIKPDLDPKLQAGAYEKGGAAAMSILTEEPHFKGSFDDFRQARSAGTLPCLRKDFIISPYQIYESRVLSADAILLIVRILDPVELKDYISLAGEYDLDVLVETHDEKEVEIAMKADASLIGINNRNLETFQTNIETSIRVAKLVGEDRVLVSESGIRNRDDILKLVDGGVWNFLIGESLVRSDIPEKMLADLMGMKSHGER